MNSRELNMELEIKRLKAKCEIVRGTLKRVSWEIGNIKEVNKETTDSIRDELSDLDTFLIEQ